jgi:hypothetical protein
VQYFPQAFLRPDLPDLVSWLARRRREGRPSALTVHEYWPPRTGSPRRAWLRARCRRALRALASESSTLIVTQPYAAGELMASGVVPGARPSVIPVGSGIPRAAGGSSAGGLSTLVMFGQPAGFDPGAVAAVARWLGGLAHPPRFWWFSRSEREMRAWWLERVRAPIEVAEFHGGLPADVLSRRLAEGTVALAPYIDGASTRRSSLVALIEHGLPVVALDGRYTDTLLRESGALTFAPLGAADQFAHLAAELLDDRARRDAMAANAARLFRERLAWPRIAEAYRAAVGGAP